LTSKCPAITRGGEPCRGLVRPGNDYCPAHDPKRQEARRRAASKAGKSKPGRELVDIKQRLSNLAEDVLEGRVETGIGAVASQIYNVLLRAVSVELKVREQEQIMERIEELEALMAQRREEGGRRGA
jgi:hypothetical protein